MVTSIIIVELMVFGRRAPKRAIMSHDDYLLGRIWVLLHCPSPELVQILIELFMIIVLIWERIPTVFQLALSIFLDFILDTAAQPDND